MHFLSSNGKRIIFRTWPCFSGMFLSRIVRFTWAEYPGYFWQYLCNFLHWGHICVLSSLWDRTFQVPRVYSRIQKVGGNLVLNWINLAMFGIWSVIAWLLTLWMVQNLRQIQRTYRGIAVIRWVKMMGFVFQVFTKQQSLGLDLPESICRQQI